MTKENTIRLYKALKAQGHPGAEKMLNQKHYEYLKEIAEPKQEVKEDVKKSKGRTK